MPSEFCHFEVYYTAWYEKFLRPADPLVLFIHWSMIQNRFKCFYDSELHDQLPSNWLSSNGYYDFHYKKYDLLYRLEIYITNDSLFIQLRSLVNFLDSTQYLKIADFIDTDNYKNNSKYKLVYKDMEKLYLSIKWSIDHFRTKKNPESTKPKEGENKSSESKPAADDAMEVESVDNATTCSVSSSSTQVSKKSRKEAKKNLGLICDILTNNFLKNPEKLGENSEKLRAVSSYNDLINHIKQEKAEFEMNVETYRRNSTCSSKSSEVLNSNSASNLVEGAGVPSGNARKKSNKKIRSSLKKKDADTAQKPATDGQAEVVMDTEMVPAEPAQVDEPKQTEMEKLKPKINREDKNNIERDKINRNLLFDYNPITNYFYYNKRNDGKKIDQKIMEEDEFVKQAYKKFNLVKFCEIKIVDCFRTDMFKGLKAPIKLNEDMKAALKLVKPQEVTTVEDDDDDEYDDIEPMTKSEKKKGRKKNIWRQKRRAKTTHGKMAKKVVEKNVRSNESSPLLVDTSSNEETVKKSIDLLSYFKSTKRKRSVSDSTDLPVLEMDTETVEGEKKDDDVDNVEDNDDDVIEEEKLEDEAKKKEVEEVASLEKSFVSPVVKVNISNEALFKKLTYSHSIAKSSISIERVDKTSESNLSTNLFGKENEENDLERPSKRTRKDTDDDELVDLDTSIEIKDTNGEVINSPWKSPSRSKTPSQTATKKTPGKTPNKTPLKEVVATTTILTSKAPTPKKITDKFKDIANRTIETINEFITPKKFYKNFTSTQIVDIIETSADIIEEMGENSPRILPEDKTIVRE